MGNIERLHSAAAPSGHAATLADVWRLEPAATRSQLTVREAEPGDFARIRQIQAFGHPTIEPNTFQQLEHQVSAFPEGQMVAIANGEIVGAATALVVQWDHYAIDHTWRSITGDGFFSTHDASGKTLYGVDLAIDPKRRGHGVGRALFKARRKLCQKMNLRRILGAARLSGYANLRETMSPELYAKRVVWGDIPDPLLRFQLSQGFQYCGVVREYLPEDAESCGHAALFVWLNPRYTPSRPPALAAGYRKVA